MLGQGKMPSRERCTLSWREGYLRHLNHLVAQKTLFTPLVKMPPGYQA